MTKRGPVTWNEGRVGRNRREALLGQRGCVIWFTGYSGAGKSTCARVLEEILADTGRLAYVLDGDNIRHGLNNDLGFSPEDRRENIRRIGEVAGLFADAGVIAIAAFISPYQADRERAREVAGPNRFVEVFLDVPLAVCEARDPKGLYRRARAGEIEDFTGIDSPYEPPADPEIVLDTGVLDVAACVSRVVEYMEATGLLDGQALSRPVRDRI